MRQRRRRCRPWRRSLRTWNNGGRPHRCHADQHGPVSIQRTENRASDAAGMPLTRAAPCLAVAAVASGLIRCGEQHRQSLLVSPHAWRVCAESIWRTDRMRLSATLSASTLKRPSLMACLSSATRCASTGGTLVRLASISSSCDDREDGFTCAPAGEAEDAGCPFLGRARGSPLGPTELTELSIFTASPFHNGFSGAVTASRHETLTPAIPCILAPGCFRAMSGPLSAKSRPCPVREIPEASGRMGGEPGPLERRRRYLRRGSRWRRGSPNLEAPP